MVHAWTNVAKVDFRYSDTCPFPDASSYVRITWEEASVWGIGGSSGLGMGSPAPITLGYCATTDCLGSQLDDYREAFKSVAVHEMGHSLGFRHEHQREDAVPSCPLSLDDNQNNGVIANGVYLTPYYDPSSVMNYCRGWDGSQGIAYQVGYKGADRLSAGDTFGAQQWYGARIAYWLQPSLAMAGGN